MHPNPVFRLADEDKIFKFVTERSFGALCVNGENGPLVSHVPFLVRPGQSFVEMHLVRSNAISKMLDEPQPANLAVTGPDAYISPDWYDMGDQQVPTWNYVSVHLRGTLRRLEQEELYGILDRLSQAMESRLAPKKPWSITKMTDETYAKMSRQIVPVGLDIEDVQGTWKLSQNKTESGILGAANGVAGGTPGSEIQTLSKLMRDT